jgi:thioredoxin reductase (NADPH)
MSEMELTGQVVPGDGIEAERPVLLAVDDAPEVLSAVVRDLRARYGRTYRVYRAGSGEAALEVLRDLQLRAQSVALVLADQRMPGMTGIELLAESIRLFPAVKRVLLTAYADTDVAIRAINEIRLDHYLLKPWSPPEQHLYPVLDDLLADWQANAPPPQAGIRLVGHRWSPDGHRLRDFLARNLVPFQWLDVDADDEAGRLVEAAGLSSPRLPLVFFPDGGHLERPANLELADRVGLHTRPEARVYDLIIVGGGPAGLGAAVYAASEGLSTLLLERDAPGGQAGRSASIENYLGFPVGLSGGDLARRALAQARRFGAEVLTPVEVVGFRSVDGYHTIISDDGGELSSRALLIATGVSYRLLDVPGADKLAGAGLYYGAAVTEAIAAQGQDVFILGGGNSAGQAAMYLSRFARSVTVIIREAALGAFMSSYLVDQIEDTPAIRVRPGSEVTALHGSDHLEAITVRDRSTSAEETVPTPALFVFIGATPRTEWLAGHVERDARGYLLTGSDVLEAGRRPAGWNVPRDPFWLESSTPGIFVAGDVRHRSVKRVASAVGEGAMAVQFIHQHLGGAPLTGPAPSHRGHDRAARAAAVPAISGGA